MRVGRSVWSCWFSLGPSARGAVSTGLAGGGGGGGVGWVGGGSSPQAAVAMAAESARAPARYRSFTFTFLLETTLLSGCRPFSGEPIGPGSEKDASEKLGWAFRRVARRGRRRRPATRS